MRNTRMSGLRSAQSKALSSESPDRKYPLDTPHSLFDGQLPISEVNPPVPDFQANSAPSTLAVDGDTEPAAP